MVLLAANGYAVIDTGKISIDKLDQLVRMYLPPTIQGVFLFQQITCKIKRRPRSTVIRLIMVFKELLPEHPTLKKIRNLNVHYPCPKFASWALELRIPHIGQYIQQSQNVHHIARYKPARCPGSIVNTKRPG